MFAIIGNQEICYKIYYRYFRIDRLACSASESWCSLRQVKSPLNARVIGGRLPASHGRTGDTSIPRRQRHLISLESHSRGKNVRIDVVTSAPVAGYPDQSCNFAM